MAPGSSPNTVTAINEETHARLTAQGFKVEDRGAMRVVIVPDAVYAAERRKIARRRTTNKNARNQRNKNRK